MGQNYLELHDNQHYLLNLLLQIPKPPPIAMLPRDYDEERNSEREEKIRLDQCVKRMEGTEGAPDKIHFFPIRRKYNIILKNARKGVLCSLQYEYNEKNNKIYFETLYEVFYDKSSLGIFSLFPENQKLCMYNETRFNQLGIWGLIFTDNILIAHILGRNMPWNDFGANLNYLWTSFWTHDRTLDGVDWSALKGKCIYYYLVRHSGFDWKQTCENAMEILNKLSPLDGEKITKKVIFLSYEHNDNIPMFLSEDSFRESYNALTDEHALEPDSSIFLWNVKTPIQRKYLLPPLFYEYSATLFYDAQPNARTKLLLDIGLAASQGKAFIASFQEPASPIGVAYIHADKGDSNFLEDMESSLLKYCANINPGGVCKPRMNCRPHDALEANHILCSKNIFESYPYLQESLNPNKISVGKFNYFSFDSPNFNYRFLTAILSNRYENLSNIKLLIIDIPGLFSCMREGNEWCSFNWELARLRQRLTVIISDDILGKKVLGRVQNLPLDKIIHLQRQPVCNPNEILLKLNIERNDTPLDEHIRKSFLLSLNTVSANSKWNLGKRMGYTKKEKLNLVMKYQKMKICKQALLLDVSASYIKKLRREAKLVKPMPQRAPKCSQTFISHHSPS